MYRGSTFLLQKDFRIHRVVVREVLRPQYDSLLAFRQILRIVNFRSHRVVRELAELAPPAPGHGGPSLGVLGFLLALMPGVFGYAVSWYLARCDAGRVHARANLVRGWRSRAARCCRSRG